MAVKLRELYESVKKFDIELLAGSKGLDNIVRWVHMVESINLSVFLEGHEVAFTTGVGINEDEDLLELVMHTHVNNASGMVINIGPHIKLIPDDVIKFCNDNDFPLFQVPWNIYMAEIMREFTYKITVSDIMNMELSNAVKNAIFFHDQESLYVPHFERHAFQAHWSYCLTVVEVIEKKNKKIITSKKRKKILKCIENYSTDINKRTFTFELDKRFVIVFAKYTNEKIEEIVDKIKKKCEVLLSEKEEMYFCIGYSAKNIKCIGKSYQKALNVLKLQKKKNNYNEVTSYKNLGLYKLLLSLEDNEIIEEYYKENLESLMKFDDLNDTDYVDVLRCYLEFNGSVKEVAARLFYHRNTINYKIKKIEEILECNLSELEIRLKLIVAFMLLDIK